MKIIMFTDSFLPGFKGGGPITSVSNLVKLLNNSFNILVCTRSHDFGENEPYQNIISDKITKYQEYNVIYLSNMDKENISKVIEIFNPDLIYLNSFFSKTTQAVMFLNKFRFKKKIIVAPRGELQQNSLNIKKAKKSLYLFVYKLFRFYKNIHFHSTDAIETNSIKSMFNIDSEELKNAVKIYKFKPLIKNDNELKLVFVSRISRKKNLHYALKLLSSIQYNISFDIFGPKEDIYYWKECEKIIDRLPSNIKVSYKGSLPQNQIVDKMREYHAFLFPTLSENFGHVIVEAMQAGLIPVLSDQTPWRKLESANAGWDIPLGENKQYIQAIKTIYIMNNEEYSQLSSDVMSFISNKLNMNKLKYEYIDFFNKVKKGENV